MNCRRPLSLVALATLSLAACGDRAIGGAGEEDRQLDYGECTWVEQAPCDGLECAETEVAASAVEVLMAEAEALELGDRIRVMQAEDDGYGVYVQFQYEVDWFLARGGVYAPHDMVGEELAEAVRAQLGADQSFDTLATLGDVEAALRACDAELEIDACGDLSFHGSPLVSVQVDKDECTRSWATVDARTGELVNCLVDQDICAEEQGGTPLVLRFDDAPVELMEAAADASFDIDGDDACTSHDWPTAATPWLALDRDLNGHIDSGAELFGSGTVLPSGEKAVNGFEALAALDTDGDGRISQRDGRFEELLLWGDEDGDKISTFAETPRASAAGLVSIDLSYERDAACDLRGNCGIERARFTYLGEDGRLRTGEVVDLHLACQ